MRHRKWCPEHKVNAVALAITIAVLVLTASATALFERRFQKKVMEANMPLRAEAIAPELGEILIHPTYWTTVERVEFGKHRIEVTGEGTQTGPTASQLKRFEQIKRESEALLKRAMQALQELLAHDSEYRNAVPTFVAAWLSSSDVFTLYFETGEHSLYVDFEGEEIIDRDWEH